MAELTKATMNDIKGIMMHNLREVTSGNYSNQDIDSERTELNKVFGDNLDFSKSLTEQVMSSLIDRLEQLYVSQFKEDKTVVAGQWCVTLPKEIWNMAEASSRGEMHPIGETKIQVDRFFEETYNFIKERYVGIDGNNNAIVATVHYDEGRRLPMTEKDWQGKTVYQVNSSGKREPVYLRDENGKVIMEEEITYGNPHIHVTVVPSREIDHEQLHRQRRYVHEQDNYREKLCSKDVFNRDDLRTFHNDLRDYLKEKGVEHAESVCNGATKEHNYTVQQLKSGMRDEYEHLREQERRIDL